MPLTECERHFCAISQQAEIVLARITICWSMDTEPIGEVTIVYRVGVRLLDILKTANIITKLFYKEELLMAKVEIKKPVVDEIIEHLNGAKSAVLADYRGITVEQDTALRKKMRESGVVYKVYKNTMIKRAIAGTEFEALGVDLDGPTAIAISKEDATAPAKILYDFAKTADALELKSGVVDGTYYDKNNISVIATIPSRDELISKFLGSIQSPITNFARVIKQIAEKNEAEA